MDDFERTVFVNCPFDDLYAPRLHAALFVIVGLGFVPRLANERLEAGENRLDKIVELARSAKFSFHDLSLSVAEAVGEVHRMNMPFELGIDLGLRRSGMPRLGEKKFIIFEARRFDLKRALSDLGGQDVFAHENDQRILMRHVRDFFRVEAGVAAPGPARLSSEYEIFQGGLIDKKIAEGHSKDEAVNVPTRERLDEMKRWVELGKPVTFAP